MERNSFYLVVGAYIAGLLISGWSWGWLGLGVIALVGALASLRVFSLPSWPSWIVAGVLAVGASPYLYLRTPRPAASDLYWLAPQSEVILEGTVVRSTGSGQNFVLRLATGQLNGLVAVRAPAQPRVVGGERVSVSGALARPQEPLNPQAFDFRAHLGRQGAFTVLSARRLEVLSRPRQSLLDWVRGRILTVHQHYLGAEAGALFSSLLIGGDAVELPRVLQERYRSAGLAHLLAASGSQVSLLAGVCAALLFRARPAVRLAVGGTVLGLFVCLAGASPSILRAALMGAMSLVALATAQKVQPISALLLAAFGLLVYDPLWLFDLGFAFSFLATFGLIVTAPVLAGHLEFLPAPVAACLAVSVAASLWTLPLQLMAFGQWSPYALLLNLLAMPIVEVLTVGGLLASTLALLLPDLAGPIDLPLGVLLHGLDLSVERVSEWSFSVLTPGVLSPLQALLLYGLLAVAHWSRLKPAPLLIGAVAVLFGPGLFAPEVTLTVLASGRSEALVIESPRRTLVINGGSALTVEHVLVPYLERRGRVVLDGVVALGSRSTQTGGLDRLLAATSVEHLYDAVPPPWSRSYEQLLARLDAAAYHRLQPQEAIALSPHSRLHVLSTEPTALVLEVFDEQLLISGGLSRSEQDWVLQQSRGLKHLHWVWMGSGRPSEGWQRLPGLQGILTSGRGPASIGSYPEHWSTDRHGALIWQATVTGSKLTTMK